MKPNEDKAPEPKMKNYTIKYDVNGVPQPPMEFNANVPRKDFLIEAAGEYVQKSLKDIGGHAPRIDVHEVIENE